MGFEDKRESILRVAEKIFAEKGYAATTLKDIAGGVEIKTPGLYYYFKSKRDIYNALMLDVYDKLRRGVLEPVKEAPDLREKITLMISLLIDFWAEHPSFPRMIAQEAIMGSRFIDNELIPKFLKPMFSEVVSVLGEGGTEQGLRGLDVPVLVYNVLGMTMFYFFSSRMFTTLIGEDSLSAKRVEIFKSEVLGLVFHGIDSTPDCCKGA